MRRIELYSRCFKFSLAKFLDMSKSHIRILICILKKDNINLKTNIPCKFHSRNDMVHFESSQLVTESKKISGTWFNITLVILIYKKIFLKLWWKMCWRKGYIKLCLHFYKIKIPLYAYELIQILLLIRKWISIQSIMVTLFYNTLTIKIKGKQKYKNKIKRCNIEHCLSQCFFKYTYYLYCVQYVMHYLLILFTVFQFSHF